MVITQSIRSATPITPGTPFPDCRAIYVGTSGNLIVTHPGQKTRTTYLNVPVGWFPVETALVDPASTAANLVAGYY